MASSSAETGSKKARTDVAINHPASWVDEPLEGLHFSQKLEVLLRLKAGRNAGGQGSW